MFKGEAYLMIMKIKNLCLLKVKHRCKLKKNHKSWPWGKMVRDSREKKMHAMCACGSKDLYSRILGGIGKGSEGQTQLQYF